uniref:Uncharacterized protein n=1 Tax=Zea mays TaxID=4577 RepID=C4J7Q7_MAIZE|nr:unknown [Zea mays]
MRVPVGARARAAGRASGAGPGAPVAGDDRDDTGGEAVRLRRVPRRAGAPARPGPALPLGAHRRRSRRRGGGVRVRPRRQVPHGARADPYVQRAGGVQAVDRGGMRAGVAVGALHDPGAGRLHGPRCKGFGGDGMPKMEEQRREYKVRGEGEPEGVQGRRAQGRTEA